MGNSDCPCLGPPGSEKTRAIGIAPASPDFSGNRRSTLSVYIGDRGKRVLPAGGKEKVVFDERKIIMTKTNAIQWLIVITVATAAGLCLARPVRAGCGGCSHSMPAGAMQTESMPDGGVNDGAVHDGAEHPEAVAYNGTEPSAAPELSGPRRSPVPAPKAAAPGRNDLDVILKSVDLAIRNLEAGKTRIRAVGTEEGESLHQAAPGSGPSVRPWCHAGAAPQAGFINTHCPIMGSPIDPAKVPTSLTRDYKGQKVAFCCGGCPGQWDKLTDEEKAAKLREAKAQP